MSTDILTRSYETLIGRYIQKKQDTWLGEQYEYCSESGEGSITRYFLESGIELVLLKNCTHHRLRESLPFARSNLIEITSLIKGHIKVRYHPDDEWTQCDDSHLIYFDWSKPLPYYDFMCEHADGIVLYVDLNAITKGATANNALQQMMTRFFRHQKRIFTRESLPIHRAITSQLMVQYSESLINQCILKARALEFLSHAITINMEQEADFCPDQRIHEMKYYIDENYDEVLQVNLLAQQFNIPKLVLQQQFKQTYGCTVYRYIQRKRMEQAAQELIVTNKSVTDIAYDVGYNNPSKFSTVFKKHYGVTPLHYRRKNCPGYIAR